LEKNGKEREKDYFLDDVNKIAVFLESMKPRSKSREFKVQVLNYLSEVAHLENPSKKGIYELVNIHLEPLYKKLIKYGFFARWTWVGYLAFSLLFELALAYFYLERSIPVPYLSILISSYFIYVEWKAAKCNKLLNLYRVL
jgi:hypothetical protein